jgi:hypothetical protein
VSLEVNMQKMSDPYDSSLSGNLSTTSATVMPISTMMISDADLLIEHLQQFLSLTILMMILLLI